jgi:hypothetical protein
VTVSEKFLETAMIMLAEQFVRLGGLSMEDSMSLSEQIIPGIDWENTALMHKGYSWLAKYHLNKRTRI